MPDPRELLRSIAHVLDDADVVHVLVHVELDGDDVLLGLHDVPPDRHPVDVLAELEVDPRWSVLGLCTTGTARPLDGGPPERVRTTFLQHRTGASVSLLRRGTRVEELPGPVVGRIPEVCRRLLAAGPVGRPAGVPGTPEAPSP